MPLYCNLIKSKATFWIFLMSFGCYSISHAEESDSASTKVYSYGENRYIAIDKDHKAAFSEDGKNFLEMVSDYQEMDDDFLLEFEDPQIPIGGDHRIAFLHGKMSLKCPSVTLPMTEVGSDKAKEILSAAVRTPLPTTPRKTEYLYKIKVTNQFIYVDAQKYNYSEKTRRVFIGKPGAMKEFSINHNSSGAAHGHIVLADGRVLYLPTVSVRALVDPSEDPLFSQSKKSHRKTERPLLKASVKDPKGLALEAIDLSDDAETPFDVKSLGIKDIPSEDTLITPCSGRTKSAQKSGAPVSSDPRNRNKSTAFPVR